MKIAIDITNKCNLNCEYCYAMKIYKDKWNTEDLTIQQFSKIIKILNTLKKDKNKISILGGEPFVHPNIDTIINILKKVNSKYFIEKNIFTNFILPFEKYLILENSDINLRISFHWELIKNKDNFFNKIKKLKKYNINTIIHFMVSKNNYNELNNYKEKILELNNLNFKLYCDFIINDNSWLDELKGFTDIYLTNVLDKDLLEIFKKSINFNINEKVKFNFDYFKNFTKNLICSENLVSIDIYGNCRLHCQDKTFNIFESKGISQLLKYQTPFQCKHDFCPCIDGLEIKKVRLKHEI